MSTYFDTPEERARMALLNHWYEQHNRTHPPVSFGEFIAGGTLDRARRWVREYGVESVEATIAAEQDSERRVS